MAAEADSEAPIGVFDRERRALTLGLVLAVLAFAAEGMGVVPALPTAVRALNGLPLFGWVFSAFMLAWIVGTVAGGQMADQRGPYMPMALGLCGFAGGLLLAASAQGMVQFIAGRLLQGLGGGAMIAAAYVAIARGYPDALRARMMALISSVWILPSLVGPVISGTLAERASWRLVFAGVVPFVAIAAILVLPPLRRFALKNPATGGSRTATAIRLALGAGLVLCMPDLRRFGLGVALASGGVGALLLIPALRALLPAGGRSALPMGLLLRSLLAFSFFGTEAFVPLGAGALRGATPTQAGLALTAASLGWIASAWVQDRLEASGGAAGRSRRMGIGFFIMAIGISIAAVGLLTHLPFYLVPVGWGIGGAGVGFAYSVGGLLCIAAAPAGQEGEVSGQLQLTEALGTAAGTSLGGALLGLLEQLGRTPREAHGSIFMLTISAALIGTFLTSRILTISEKPAPPQAP